MPKSTSFHPRAVGCALLVLALLGCSPQYDWREVRGEGAPYSILLPAKPASLARPINLDGLQVTMTMTAAEVDGTTFAVGVVDLPEDAQAPHALTAMKTALLKNLGGTVQRETASGPGGAPEMIELVAVGTGADGRRKDLSARFIARGKRVFQLVALGPENALTPDALDTFFTSFKSE